MWKCVELSISHRPEMVVPGAPRVGINHKAHQGHKEMTFASFFVLFVAFFVFHNPVPAKRARCPETGRLVSYIMPNNSKDVILDSS
jgi:hypothetical protein